MEYCVKINDENPIAVVLGGKYNNKKFSLVKKGGEEDDDAFDLPRGSKGTAFHGDPFEQLDINMFIKNRKLMDLGERIALVQSLKGKQMIDCKKFHIDSGEFLIYPTFESERIMIAGKSGTGKSYLSALYAREYLEMHPDRNVVLFSTHTDEKAYMHIPVNSVPLDEEFQKKIPTVETLRDCLVIFDDCDNLTNKKIQAAVVALNNDLIANGRKYNIHVLTLSHQLMDYSRTRNLLNEANRVVFFQGGSKYHTQRYLKVYAGLDKDQIKKITSLKSRWVCLGLTIPNYYISQSEIGLLD